MLSMSAEPVSESAEQLRAALTSVIDPELGVDVVSLGLVYYASIDEGAARIVYTLTSPACPLGPMIEQDIREAVAEVPGVESVDARLVWEPLWTPSRMNAEARAILGFDGAPAPEEGDHGFPFFPGGDDTLWQVPEPGARDDVP